MLINTYLLITLSVDGLNAPIKRHRVAEWIRKQDSCICCLPETHLRMKEIKGMEKDTSYQWQGGKKG